MSKDLSRLKPGAPTHIHLFLSAVLWSAIGFLLLTKGFYRLGVMDGGQMYIVLPAILAGSLKAFFILDKAARRGVERILTLKDGTCLGAVYSVKTWILVLCMMGMGVILRSSPLPLSLLCFLYLTVGWALLLSSRLAWGAWLKRK